MHSRGQSFLVQGVLAIVVIGAVLPVGLVAQFLVFAGQPASGAVEHGELYLAAGNAVFLGCVLLATSDAHNGAGATIASLFALATFVLPCYGAWAFINVRVEMDERVAGAASYAWGLPVLAVSLLVALSFVWCSFTSHNPNGGSKW